MFLGFFKKVMCLFVVVVGVVVVDLGIIMVIVVVFVKYSGIFSICIVYNVL